MTRAKDPLERLHASYVVNDNGCWLWGKSINWGGYGGFQIAGQRMGAHRAAYLLLVGPIPDGLDLDHLCRVRRCVNPDHLEPVTRSVNLRRGIGGGAWRQRITHCPQGHPYDDENTYNSGKGRDCRECRRAARLRYRKAKAAA